MINCLHVCTKLNENVTDYFPLKQITGFLEVSVSLYTHFSEVTFYCSVLMHILCYSTNVTGSPSYVQRVLKLIYKFLTYT
jgi:hypothetical protein